MLALPRVLVTANFQFLQRVAVLKRYTLWSCSVCPSQAGIVKMAKHRIREQRYAIAEGLSFLMPKISANVQWGHPQHGR